MTYLDALLLGIIQGLTEFLPISSSGHLVLGEYALGLQIPGVSLEIWLHMGTLVAVVVYFHRRIVSLAVLCVKPSMATPETKRLLPALIIGTLPAVAVGLLLKDTIESVFSSPVFAASMLIVTGVILFSSRLAPHKTENMTWLRGFGIGCAQALAILPGISRSGSTITAGMFMGLSPSVAAEFSFLLAIPAIGGAFVLDLVSNYNGIFDTTMIGRYLVGAIIAFIFGLASIHFLLRIISKGKFYYFGVYCLVVGIAAIIYL